jgi:hypothetical protein
MSVSSASLFPDNSTAANFRAWGKHIHDALVAAGLTLAYSNFATGTDWTDVSAPTLANDTEVTEVWAFADTLQATAPIFVKIEYGSGTAATRPSLWVTVGTVHDGSGTLTGTQISDRVQIPATNNSAILAQNCYVSADTNRICVAMFIGTSSFSFGFVTERDHDDDGTDNGNGIAVACWATTTKSEQFVPPTSGLGAPTTRSTTRLSGVTPPDKSIYGSDLGVGTWLPNKGKNLNPSRCLGFYNSTDFVTGATLIVSIYAINHTFIALGSAAVSNPMAISNVYAMMRYE